MIDDSKQIIGLCVLAFLVCVLLVTITMKLHRAHWEDEAVNSGHAEYYLDEDHNKQWRWLEVPE